MSFVKKVSKRRRRVWKTLQHNGILFPPLYESKGITIKIKDDEVVLSVEQEEMIYQWAKKKDTPYVQDRVFQQNFTKDFVSTLDRKFKKTKYVNIDFTKANGVVDQEKDSRARMTKDERKELAAQRKKVREELKIKYGKAVVDGKKVDVGNYMAEPPGIFIGRGKHPLRGKWKPRITQKDVILNLGRGEKKPDGKWKKIVHNYGATWLASWTDHLTKKSKYVWLADTSDHKQNKDREKYDKAIKLAGQITRIKNKMVKDMKDSNDKTKKIATVCYLIYRTSMRVGDEKDEEEEAVTVGATTLRKGHVRITEDSIQFDFLGKDSIRWQETIEAKGHDAQLCENLKRIIEKKGDEDEVFDGIKSSTVNDYYSKIVKGLTAKVFRTYNATTIVKKYFTEHTELKTESTSKKIYHAKRANLEAAIMCNHKRTIPKTFKQSLQKRRGKLKDAKIKKPWEKPQATLKKVRESKPKTNIQKAKKKKRIKELTSMIETRKVRHAEKIEKMALDIDLVERTKDYNLGTSLRNYIDPRVVKEWANDVGVERKKLYTAALQKKFLWVTNEDEDLGLDKDASSSK